MKFKTSNGFCGCFKCIVLKMTLMLESLRICRFCRCRSSCWNIDPAWHIILQICGGNVHSKKVSDFSSFSNSKRHWNFVLRGRCKKSFTVENCRAEVKVCRHYVGEQNPLWYVNFSYHSFAGYPKNKFFLSPLRIIW